MYEFRCHVPDGATTTVMSCSVDGIQSVRDGRHAEVAEGATIVFVNQYVGLNGTNYSADNLTDTLCPRRTGLISPWATPCECTYSSPMQMFTSWCMLQRVTIYNGRVGAPNEACSGDDRSDAS